MLYVLNDICTYIIAISILIIFLSLSLSLYLGTSKDQETRTSFQKTSDIHSETNISPAAHKVGKINNCNTTIINRVSLDIGPAILSTIESSSWEMIKMSFL